MNFSSRVYASLSSAIFIVYTLLASYRASEIYIHIYFFFKKFYLRVFVIVRVSMYNNVFYGKAWHKKEIGIWRMNNSLYVYAIVWFFPLWVLIMNLLWICACRFSNRNPIFRCAKKWTMWLWSKFIFIHFCCTTIFKYAFISVLLISLLNIFFRFNLVFLHNPSFRH